MALLVPSSSHNFQFENQKPNNTIFIEKSAFMLYQNIFQNITQFNDYYYYNEEQITKKNSELLNFSQMKKKINNSSIKLLKQNYFLNINDASNQVFQGNYNGLINSQKNTSTKEIVIGSLLQQVSSDNNQLIKPNDIILNSQTVADVHCMIIQNQYYERENLTNSNIMLLYCLKQFILKKKSQNSNAYCQHYTLPSNIIQYIFRFTLEVNFMIRDVSEKKYRTYLKVKQFSLNGYINEQRQLMNEGDQFLLSQVAKIQVEQSFQKLEVFFKKFMKMKNIQISENLKKNSLIVKFYHYFKKNGQAQFIGIDNKLQMIISQIKQNQCTLEDCQSEKKFIKSQLKRGGISLRVNSPHQQPQQYVLVFKDQQIYTIGRRLENNIIIKNNEISRFHATIQCVQQKTKKKWIISDGNQLFNSFHGTYKLLKKQINYILDNNDEFLIGQFKGTFQIMDNPDQ